MVKSRLLTLELKTPVKPASEAALTRFERTTRLTIPREYREFLKCQNGGIPQKRNFRYGKGPYQDSVLRHFLGVGGVLRFEVSLFLKIYEGRIPEQTFPIACDEFDNMILVSQKRGTTNQVLFWDHEKELSRDPTKFIADDLKSFLAMLEPDKIVEYHIATITFQDGEVQRLQASSKLYSTDRKKVILLQNAKIGEKIDDFGITKKIRSITYTKELGVG